MNFIKKHWKTVLGGVSSIAFGFLAVFLGGKLYLTRNASISPSAPQSMPAAAFTNSCQGFSLTFTTPVSITTPEATASAVPSASPTDSPLAQVTVTTSASPTTSSSPTESPIALATSTPAPIITSSPQPTNAPHVAFECNSVCSSNSECLTIGSSYSCYNTGTDSRCRIETNLTSVTCAKTIASNNSTVPSPVSNQLPHAGVGIPTTIILSFAAILIVGSLLLI